MDNEDLGLPWLKPMLGASYFSPCRLHGVSTKSECNMFCLDCMGNALCSYCLAHHRDHHSVQVNSWFFQSNSRSILDPYVRMLELLLLLCGSGHSNSRWSLQSMSLDRVTKPNLPQLCVEKFISGILSIVWVGEPVKWFLHRIDMIRTCVLILLMYRFKHN